jgi:hypothetical protein
MKVIGQDRSDGKTRKKCKQLLDDVKEMRGYGKLKDEAIDCTLWRTRFGRGCGPVVKMGYEMKEWMKNLS